MKLLVIDTATKYLSLAIAEGSRIIACYNKEHDRQHSRLLIPVLLDMLKRSKIKPQELDCLGINQGPGSFTGLRIGLAATKGLGKALNIPAIGIPSLDVIAFGVKDKNSSICAIIDAKRQQVYGAFYENKDGKLRRASGYLLEAPEKLAERVKKEILFAGDAVSLYGETIKKINPRALFAEEKYWYPHPESLARMVFDEYKRQKSKKFKEVLPLYLYANTCTVQQK